MTLRAIAVTLIWGGVLVLLGLLMHRFTRGAWSLEDEHIPAVSIWQKLVAILALTAAAAGLALFIWSWNGVG